MSILSQMSGKLGGFSIADALDKSMNNTSGERPEGDRYQQESGGRYDRGWRNGGDNDDPRYRRPNNRSSYSSQRYGGQRYENRGGYSGRGKSGGNYRHQSNLRFSLLSS